MSVFSIEWFQNKYLLEKRNENIGEHCCYCLVAKLCPTLVNPWIVACQAPPSMGFPRQENWSGLPCPPPGAFPNPGIKPAFLASPALAGGFFTTEPPGKTILSSLYS